MPSTTTYAQLWMYNSTTDREQLFLDFRDNLAGTKPESNMQKIDKLLSNANDRLVILESAKFASSITTVKAIVGASDNSYVATNVEDFTSYKNNMLLLIYFSKNNVGLTTITINESSQVSLMKINSEGQAVNLDANDLKKNVGYLFQYDGTQLILVGEKFESVVTSETQPTNQSIGGIWNKTTNDGGITIYVKQSDGSYTELSPTTKALFISFNDNQTLEAFKTEINNKIISLETLTNQNKEDIKARATTVTYTGKFTASGWNASSNGFEQRVNMAVKASDTAVPWGIIPSGTVLTSAEEEAYSKVTNLATFDGYVMGYCREDKPITDFNFIVRVVR